MFASMWMTKDVLTVTPGVSVIDIAKMMAEHKIRRLPVLDKDGALLGLVSAQDVLHAFPADVNPFAVVSGKGPDAAVCNLTAQDVMVREPLCIAPETPIEEAARLMLEHKIGAMLIMRQGQLQGLITESDIFRAFAGMFDPGTQGVRISFDNSLGRDVFPLVAELTEHHHLRVMSFVSLHKHERPMCVVQVTGTASGIEAMLNDIWKSRHPVISVINLMPEKTDPAN